MHKRTLHSLLIVSFIVVFAASMSLATDQIIINGKDALHRCIDQSITVTANIDADISALEVVLAIDEVDDGFLEELDALDPADVVTWDLGVGTLTDRVIDNSLCDGVAPDYLRFAAMSTGPTPENLAFGTDVPIATIHFHTSEACDGHATVEGYTIPASPPFGPITTQFVDAVSGLIRPVTVLGDEVGIENKAPSMVDCPDPEYTILHGTTWGFDLSATDTDVGNGCETLTYFIKEGPPDMTCMVDHLEWITDGDDVCVWFDQNIIVGVYDECKDTALCEPFKICVNNTPPYFTVWPDNTTPEHPDMVQIGWGDTYEFTFDADDDDPGPYGPIFNVIDWAYAPLPAPTISNVSGFEGDFAWATLYDESYIGDFHVFVEVNDAAPLCDPCSSENADTVDFWIRVVPFQLTIEKKEMVILGQEEVVAITMADDDYINAPMAGFDFLIQYDNSAMTFLYAEEGAFLGDGADGCDWEYFTYRYGPNGNCGPGACPSGVLRVVAMAETTGGNLADHPDCFTNDPPDEISNELVLLHFLVANDATLECNFAPIRWVWYDCADNSVSDTTGEFLYISKLVFDFAGWVDPEADPKVAIWNDVTNMDVEFPTLTGAPIPTCDVWFQDNQEKGHPWRLIYFYNGGLDLACADQIDFVGDINLNEIAYEIADAVMFTNYFIIGTDAFGDHIDGSVAASDTNKDGITLSVADLVYLIRVVIGDALPYDYAPKGDPVTAQVTYGNDTFGIEGEMGAAHIVLEGNVTPTLLADNMEMMYGFNGQVTNILVYSLEANQSFSGDFLHADGRIVSTEFATFTGQPVLSKLMPTTFKVGQNYPNPFNPGTSVDLQIPNGGAWRLDVYNINGQLVESLSGVSEGGFETVNWDASDLSSGVYFYKVTAGQHSLTKKAVLLK